MSIGEIVTIISAVALALTVTADKLMVGDFYQSNPRSAWFVSSVFGVVLGLFATIGAWKFHAKTDLINDLSLFIQGETIFLAAMMIGVGVMVSFTLLSYFLCMARDSISTSVAVAIAATPIFVFGIQLLLTGSGWGIGHLISFAVTIIGLIGFELMSEHDEEDEQFSINWPLAGVIFFGTMYLISVDYLFPIIETATGLDETQASLMAMPFYWIGFGFGIVSIRHQEVRDFLTKELNRWHLLLLVLVLEIIGASFYFFEFFGLSKISATLVALITGAHIVLVWIFDLYVRKCYQLAVETENTTTRILFFNLPTSKLDAYDIRNSTLSWQAMFIVLTLLGLWLWP